MESVSAIDMLSNSSVAFLSIGLMIFRITFTDSGILRENQNAHLDRKLKSCNRSSSLVGLPTGVLESPIGSELSSFESYSSLYLLDPISVFCDSYSPFGVDQYLFRNGTTIP